MPPIHVPRDKLERYRYVPWDKSERHKYVPWDMYVQYNLHVPWDNSESHRYVPWDMSERHRYVPWDMYVQYNLHVPWDNSERHRYVPWDMSESHRYVPWDIFKPLRHVPWDVYMPRRHVPWDMSALTESSHGTSLAQRMVPWDKLVYMAHRFPPCASRRPPYHIRKSPSTSTVCSYPLCESFKLTVYCSCRVPEKNTSQYYVRVVFILRCHLDPTRRPMSNDTAGKVNFQPR